MIRDIANLESQTFDVLVIGGGIHGATVAWKCAALGMKVALIEKNDFGSVTSANSLKIIHGGFRYLQHLNIKRMRESIISRRIMSQVSPHNIKALKCVIPTSGFGLRSRFLMRIALMINDIIAFDRNKGIAKDCKIPAGKIISLEQCKKLFPLLDWSGKDGGAVWYDAIALNSERLTFSFIQQAVEMGACVANYLDMQELIVENGILKGCGVFDSIDKKILELRGKTVVVTGGASNDRLLGIHQSKKNIQKKWAKAVNVIVKKELLGETAIGLTGETDFVDNDAIIKKQGRFFFFVPWRGYTMIGTTYNFESSSTDQVRAVQVDINEILNEVNEIFPEANLLPADVSKVHAGLVPAYSNGDTKEDDVQLVKETEIFDLGKKIVNPVQGLFAVKSVKFTTAPVVATDVANIVSSFLGTKYQNKNVDSMRNSGSSNNTFSDKNIWYTTISARYGRDSKRVSQYLNDSSELICENPPVYTEEIDYFVKEEMANTLSDVVFRRSEIGTAECPDHDTLMRIAERMAVHFAWDRGRIEAEVKIVKESFKWN